MNWNACQLAGNLTRDVEMRYLPNGTAVCKFSIAVNRNWTQNGEKKTEVSFFDCEAWAKQAETIAQYCKKGSGLFVSGRLKVEEWEAKGGGGKRSKIIIVVEQFQFVGGKSDAKQSEPASAPAASDTAPEEDLPPF